MGFSQNNRIPDLEWDYLAVFGRFERHRGVYLPATISERNSWTARRAATLKSALDCDA